jgi:hypothetical protein
MKLVAISAATTHGGTERTEYFKMWISVSSVPPCVRLSSRRRDR